MGAVKEPTGNRYESDFAAWAFEQAEAIKRGDWRALDIPNLVEELESMGKQQRAELRNRLVVLLMHLAKWDKQAAMRSRSWRTSIDIQRIDIADHMEDNPSLEPYASQAMARAWKVARLDAARETGLSIEAFEEQCPYTWEQATDPNWMPK